MESEDVIDMNQIMSTIDGILDVMTSPILLLSLSAVCFLVLFIERRRNENESVRSFREWKLRDSIKRYSKRFWNVNLIALIIYFILFITSVLINLKNDVPAIWGGLVIFQLVWNGYWEFACCFIAAFLIELFLWLTRRDRLSAKKLTVIPFYLSIFSFGDETLSDITFYGFVESFGIQSQIIDIIMFIREILADVGLLTLLYLLIQTILKHTPLSSRTVKKQSIS
jgi:hypothetical protein